MINIYDNIRGENGGIVPGRTKLFIVNFDESGEITLSEHGTQLTPEGTGTMFIVDDWLINQLDKVQFIDGQLKVKDGMTLDEPVKSEKQKAMEELQRQMAELQAMPDEPAEIEENTETQPAE